MIYQCKCHIVVVKCLQTNIKMHNKLGKQKYITKYQNDKCQAAFNAMRFMYSISFFHLMSKPPLLLTLLTFMIKKLNT